VLIKSYILTNPCGQYQISQGPSEIPQSFLRIYKQRKVDVKQN